jgi:hypothetical protein
MQTLCKAEDPCVPYRHTSECSLVGWISGPRVGTGQIREARSSREEIRGPFESKEQAVEDALHGLANETEERGAA